MSAHIEIQPSAREQLDGDTANLIEEIRAMNLNYLILAQHLIRKDRAQAMFRLGLSTELADVINNLTIAQVMEIARLPQMLCRFRFVEHDILNLLGDKMSGRVPLMPNTHAAILLAGSPAEHVV
ncbi:flagellar transcriptional regulator FlhD [Burkholderia gladioli]|nr:flagellar transcriptional regulator FlhD [Burkholderia gladioli]